MKLRLTLLRSKTYTRIAEYSSSAENADATSENAEPKEVMPDIDGIWLSSEFTVVIKGKAITVIENKNIINAEISSRNENSISIASDNEALSAFSDLFYILDEDTLTVIPSANPAAIITLKRNQR